MEQQLAQKAELTKIITELTSPKEDTDRELIKAGFIKGKEEDQSAAKMITEL